MGLRRSVLITGGILLPVVAGGRPYGPHRHVEHSTQMIAAEPDLRIEVLDWEGTGPPLLFLAGLGSTAHVFDEFAPRLADRFHVYGLTRRGYGRSSRPDGGYTPHRLALDIRAVLDSLGIERAILVGHSFAGDEMSLFAQKFADRVAALVYLDAAHDRTGLPSLAASAPDPDPPPMTSADSASSRGVQAYLSRYLGARLPIEEVRFIARFDENARFSGPATPDAITASILAGVSAPVYEEITAPVLAIYAVPNTPEDYFPYYSNWTTADRATADRAFQVFAWWERNEIARLRRAMPAATVIVMEGANHYVFLTAPDVVEDAMRRFLVKDG